MAFSFGATTSQPSAGFFGTNNANKGFGFDAAKSTPSLFPQASTQNTAFGFGGLKNPATNTFGGFGATTTSTNTFGGFGAATTSTNTFTGFGAPTTSTSTFGGFGAPATSTNTFGGFGAATTTNAFGGFGATTAPATNLFANSQQQQQTQQQQKQLQQQALTYSVTTPTIFADERDQVLMKWNQLQACWGFGKGYYSPQGEFVTYTPENPYCLFKSIGYSCNPCHKNESGLVNLIFQKSPTEVSTNHAQIVDAIHKLLGSKPNHIVCVDGIKPLQDKGCEVSIYVQDRQVSGVTNRVPSNDLFNFLNQSNIKQQLNTQLTVIDVYVKVSMDDQQLKFYLQNPPAGIDSRIWEQAKLDNPDPKTHLPVPIVGFQELMERLKHQRQQAELHKLKLSCLTTDSQELRHKLQGVSLRSDELKRKQTSLSHRLLKVIAKQEVLRKWGFPLQPEEELLSGHVQSLHCELTTPNQFKSRLTELLRQLGTCHVSRPDVAFKLDHEVSHDIKQHLMRQQEGLKHLVEVLKGDMNDLKTMDADLSLLSKSRK